MATKMPQQFGALKAAIATGDERQIAKTATDLGLAGAFSAFALRHAMTPRTTRAMAETDSAYKELFSKDIYEEVFPKETAKQPEVSNAVQQRGPEALPIQVPPEAGQGMGTQVRNAEAPALPQVKEQVILFSDRVHELRAVGPLKEGKIDPDALYTIEPPVISGGIADIRTGQGLLDSGC